MKKLIPALMLFSAFCRLDLSFGAEPRFIKVSDHVYYLPLKDSGENVVAVAMDDGVLLINPPPEPDLSLATDALKNVTQKAMRWIVFTEPRFFQNINPGHFPERNSMLIGSTKLRSLVSSGPDLKEAVSAGDSSLSWFVFGNQMRLFPSNVEIRIIAVQTKARTGGDVFVFVPGEKVLIVGALFEAAQYPDIDMLWGGSAIGWLDGMKQVIDSVPLLKSAIPQAKPDPKSEQEMTIEEGITVISDHGEPSNLQNMKDLFESSKKLRNDIAKAVKAGRSRESFLASSVSTPYRSYANLESFAAQLFLEAKPASPSH